MLGCLSTLAVVAVAIAAGLGELSFWWVLIPALLAASFLISNGPGYHAVLKANEEGRLTVFPTVLLLNIMVQLAIAGAIFWLTQTVA